MCFPFFFLDLVNVYFCVVFRITFAKVQPCAGDVKYFTVFFQFICRYIYKSLLFAEKNQTSPRLLYVQTFGLRQEVNYINNDYAVLIDIRWRKTSDNYHLLKTVVDSQ